MKHYFIINPIAGGCNQTEKLTKEIEAVFLHHPEDYAIYITQGAGDGERQVRSICKNTSDEITFYACGGDGTTYEVANGLIGYPHAHLAIIATGSCNDFLKNFPQYDFRSIEKAVLGSVKLIDALKVNDRYTINVVNMGYDARVNADTTKYKKKIKNIHKAYNKALIKNLIKRILRPVKVEVNDDLIFKGKMLLMTFANGCYYGGGYKCAPLAICDDGMLELTIAYDVSRLKFLRLVKYYKQGLHINNSKFDKYIFYRRVEKAKVIAPEPLNVCLDGEDFLWQTIEIEACKQIVKLILPKN